MITESKIKAFIEWYEEQEYPEKCGLKPRGISIGQGRRGKLYDLCGTWLTYKEYADIADRKGDWTMRSHYNYKASVAMAEIEQLICKYRQNGRKDND